MNSLTRRKKVGSRIKNLREEKKYSQEYMARKLDISQNVYSRIETGQAKLDTERLVQIADILDVSILSLLELSDQQVIKIRQVQNQTINGDINNHIPNEKIQQELEALKAQVTELVQRIENLKKGSQK